MTEPVETDPVTSGETPVPRSADGARKGTVTAGIVAAPTEAVGPASRTVLLRYLLVFLPAAAIVTLNVAPWDSASSEVFTWGADYEWQHAMVQVFAQSGPFGSTDHLAWPIGMSGWTLPQFGLLLGSASWVLTGLLGIPAIYTVFMLLALGAGLTAVGHLFLIRTVLGDRFPWLAGTVALALATTLVNLHLVVTLAMWYLVPVTLAFLFRWARSDSHRRRLLLLGLAVAALASPLWWVTMLAVFLPVVLLAPLAHRRWVEFRGVFAATAVLWVALAAQATLFALHAGPGSETQRENGQVAWGSGTLSDLLAGTNLQRALLPGAEDITGGLNLIGTLASLLAFAGFVWLLTLPSPVACRSRLLRVATALGSLLFFIVGGLGSLMVLVATVAGLTNPVRNLRYFALVLALVVAVEALAAVRDRWGGPDGNSSGTVPAAIAVVVAVAASALGLADQAALRIKVEYDTGSAAVLPAVRYLQSSLDPCPVAQLPQDQIVGTRIVGGELNRGYQDLAPYLLAPEFYWSHGAYEPGQSNVDNPLNRLGVVLDDESLGRLREAGFCAVLHDDRAAGEARTLNVRLEGRDLAISRQPDFREGAFSVYLLTR